MESWKTQSSSASTEIVRYVDSTKIWKHGVRARIFKQEFDATKGEWIDKLNPNSKLATDTWLENVKWRDYEYKTKPTLATHAQEIVRQASLH